MEPHKALRVELVHLVAVGNESHVTATELHQEPSAPSLELRLRGHLRYTTRRLGRDDVPDAHCREGGTTARDNPSTSACVDSIVAIK